MRGSLWISTLSVVLILIQKQFMTVNAADTCPRLEIPPGAILINSTCNNTYGSKCVFICKDGYVMIRKDGNGGNVTRTCSKSGQWSGNPIKCTERRPPTMAPRASGKIPLSVKIFLGSLILIVMIAVATVVVRVRRRLRFNAPRPRLDPGDVDVDVNVDVAFDNPSYWQPRSLPDSVITLRGMGSPQAVPQSHPSFSSLHIVDRGHCPTLDNTEKEVIPLDLSSSETLQYHLPLSFPKYITKVEATFTNTGGELSASLESDIRIIVPSDAIPAGINQNIFFGVFSEETILLRDIPEAPDKTIISPVVECGPHDIHLSKPVEIIVPHCLCLSHAKMEWITVYRCVHFPAQGRLNWERVPIEAEKSSQSQAVFLVKEDAIHIKTKTFSLWSIFACGGPRRKRARVFSNRPDPKSDLIYLRFYVYSDNMDSKRRVELAEEQFTDSRPTREKPFRLYKDNRVITVKLTDLEKGWNSDKPDNTQRYEYEKGFRSKDACDFAVKPEDGRDVNGFFCDVKFQQEGDHKEHSFYLNPGFTPLKRQSIRQSSTEGGRSDTTSGTSQYDGSADWDHYISSLGSEPVTQDHIYEISPDVGRDWKNLLRSLAMKEKVIENLSEDYKHDKISEQCIQGLIQWKELDPQLATIKTLAIALHHVGCFDALQTLRKLQCMEHQ